VDVSRMSAYDQRDISESRQARFNALAQFGDTG
jgi:hypothetical protein